jgi:murein DD-endopeptidase MepM/ murein hydrolase activator NlpD
MNIFAIIANIINKLLSFSLFPSLPSLGGNETTIEVDPSKRGDFANSTPAKEREASEHGVRGRGASNRCQVSVPEVINPNARFHSTGSPAWSNQFAGTDMAGQHGGTDFTGPQGTAVYNPLPMTIIAIGHYADSGRYGDYVIGTTTDGLEYYSGHLQNVSVSVGQVLECGTKIGEMNLYAHTHVQIKQNGQIIDPESVLT